MFEKVIGNYINFIYLKLCIMHVLVFIYTFTLNEVLSLGLVSDVRNHLSCC